MRRYEATDYPEIVSWLEKRGLNLSQKMDLPEVGYFEPGVACGFLIQTDTKTALFDFFISSPEVSRKARSRAIESITSELIKHARWLHYKRINCSIAIMANKERAKTFGFREVGDHTEFVKEL